MSSSSRSLARQIHDDHATWELNLAPMLDMLCTLMCVMLFSFSTMKIGIIETSLPQPVADAIEKDKKNDKPNASATLNISGKKEMTLIVRAKDGGERRIAILAFDGTFNYKKLHAEAVDFKQRYPEIFRIEFNPGEDVDYKDIVKLMDQVRHIQKGDPKFFIKDEKTGKDVENPMILPNVVFSNVVEG